MSVCKKVQYSLQFLIVLIMMLVLGCDSGEDNKVTPLPVVTVANSGITEGDTGMSDLVFMVNLSSAATANVTVGYATSDGSATAGSDYTAVSDTLTIPAGQTTASINIPVIGDTTVEPDETLTLTLSNPIGVTIGIASASGTINNDDQVALPTINISDAFVTEGNTGFSNLSFNVSLSAQATNNVTVDFATSNGTATAGSDYTAVSNTLTIPAAQASGTIDVQIVGDTTVESDETITLTLSNPSGATLAVSSATGSIINDDGPIQLPIVSVSDASVMEGNTATSDLSFIVNLSTPATTDVTVNYATSDGSATAGSDYTSTSNVLTILAGASSGNVIISVSGDTIFEPDETLTLTLSNPSGATLGASTATGTITNDDASGAVSGLDQRPVNTNCLAGDRPGATDSTIALERAFPNITFVAPLAMIQAPGDSTKWYVVEKNGRVISIPDNAAVVQTDKTTFIDITTSAVDADFEGGLLGMAFHPAYAVNGYVFLSYTTSDDPVNDNGANFTSIISRFKVNTAGTALDTASEQILITLPQPYHNHNGGNIAFGSDGYLYIGFGDGGSGVAADLMASQKTTNLLGTMLRIDVNVTPQEEASGIYYKIPATNPFASSSSCGAATNCPEIYAWGFRNPWKWSFDRQTSNLWVGDVGQNAWEEVDLVELGKNYGWRCYEANQANAISACAGLTGFTFPVVAYDHTQGSSISGGYVYRGSMIPDLTGVYLYGDYGNGNIWGLSDPYGTPSEQLMLNGTGLRIASFAESNAGELYALDIWTGQIHRIIAGTPSAPTVPTQLSQTGCADPSNPKLATSGMIPYELNSALWSDYAEKFRWFAIPDSTQITMLSDGNWDFPIGSVLRKDFYLVNKIIETRLLMRHNDGGWAGYSYEWNTAETEAMLLSDVKVKTVTGVTGPQDWTFPSPSHCLQCHNDSAARALGPETSQMNRAYLYTQTGRTANQISTYDAIGLFSTSLPAPPETLPKLVDPFNATEPLELRARSYLHSNCSNCHRPGGGGRGPADFRFDVLLADMGVCNVIPAISDLGITNARLLFPGDPARSIISARMHDLAGNRMPPLGSAIEHTEGTQLIDAWITSISVCP